MSSHTASIASPFFIHALSQTKLCINNGTIEECRMRAKYPDPRIYSSRNRHGGNNTSRDIEVVAHSYVYRPGRRSRLGTSSPRAFSPRLPRSPPSSTFQRQPRKSSLGGVLSWLIIQVYHLSDRKDFDLRIQERRLQNPTLQSRFSRMEESNGEVFQFTRPLEEFFLFELFPLRFPTLTQLPLTLIPRSYIRWRIHLYSNKPLEYSSTKQFFLQLSELDFDVATIGEVFLVKGQGSSFILEN